MAWANRTQNNIRAATVEADVFKTNAPVKSVPDTTYALSSADDGRILVFTAATAVTLNISAGVAAAGFQVLLVDRVTTGGVTPTGVTIIQRQSNTKTAGSGALASLVAIADDILVFGGDTA